MSCRFFPLLLAAALALASAERIDIGEAIEAIDVDRDASAVNTSETSVVEGNAGTEVHAGSRDCVTGMSYDRATKTCGYTNECDDRVCLNCKLWDKEAKKWEWFDAPMLAKGETRTSEGKECSCLFNWWKKVELTHSGPNLACQR
mmetsp:Transcript_51381/g.144787  ORF Transcript_51381/g.144787 Transcript_51381/m.144787 type:complete len:145 (+) Transcript_51381:88-522(+)